MALDRSFISVLLPCLGFDKLGWITLYEKAIKICKKDDVVSLCQKIAKLLHIDALNRMNAIYTYIDRFMNLIHRDYRMSIGTFDE